MKTILAILLLLSVPAWAGEVITTPATYHYEGSYVDEYCQICEKRLKRWVRPKYGSWPNMSVTEIAPYIDNSKKVYYMEPEPEANMIVCMDCYEQFNWFYRCGVRGRVNDLIQSYKEKKSYDIKSNRADNAIYKERLEEIEKLKDKIRELENDKFKASGGVTWYNQGSGTSRIVGGKP